MSSVSDVAFVVGEGRLCGLGRRELRARSDLRRRRNSTLPSRRPHRERRRRRIPKMPPSLRRRRRRPHVPGARGSQQLGAQASSLVGRGDGADVDSRSSFPFERAVGVTSAVLAPSSSVVAWSSCSETSIASPLIVFASLSRNRRHRSFAQAGKAIDRSLSLRASGSVCSESNRVDMTRRVFVVGSSRSAP